MCVNEEMDNTYGCDKCGELFEWDKEIIWITSSCGVCLECYDKMSEPEKHHVRFLNGDEVSDSDD